MILYCAGGVRSLFAGQDAGPASGYTDVVSMTGGFDAWKGQGLRVDRAVRPHAPSSGSATAATC